MPNRVIKNGIWHSKKLAKCSIEAQLHYPRLYLLIDDWGCFEIDLDVIKGTVYPKIEITCKKIGSLMDEYEKNSLLFTWKENSSKFGYFIGKEEGRLPSPTRRHKRKTPPTPEKPLKKYIESYEKATECLQEDTKKVQEAFPNPNLNPYPNHSPNLNPKPSPKKVSDIDKKLVQLLIDLMQENDPDSYIIATLTEKRQQTWLNACRLLREKNKRSPELIEEIIRFSQADDFWRGNILSMPTLREKFDKLFLKAKKVKFSGIEAWLSEQEEL